MPKIMTEEEELETAVAALLGPEMFGRAQDTQWGHVRANRERLLRRARRLIRFIRQQDHTRRNA